MNIPFVIMLLFAILERSPRLRFRPSRLLRRYYASDVFYLLTGFIAGGSLVAMYISVATQWLGSLLRSPRLAALELPLWLSVLLALLVLDFSNYFAHYLLHRYDLFWEFHKIHHSSAKLDWLATFRSHILEQTLRRLIAPILLILIGFPTYVVALAGGVFIAWGIFNHANLRFRLDILETILITPHLHRVHHLPNMSHTNLGTIFSFWDRLRGTLTVVEIEPDTYFGNGEPLYPQSWLPQFIEPFRRIGLLLKDSIIPQERDRV
ncbi:MAG: sterol desaturase family protein [Acidobacteriota bacterium]